MASNTNKIKSKLTPLGIVLLVCLCAYVILVLAPLVWAFLSSLRDPWFYRMDSLWWIKGKEGDVLFKRRLRFFVRSADKEGGKPCVADFDSPQRQHGLEDSRILRILVAHLGAREARQRHLADALAEGVFAAQLGQVVIGPSNGRNAQLYIFSRKHFSVLLSIVWPWHDLKEGCRRRPSVFHCGWFRQVPHSTMRRSRLSWSLAAP